MGDDESIVRFNERFFTKAGRMIPKNSICKVSYLFDPDERKLTQQYGGTMEFTVNDDEYETMSAVLKPAYAMTYWKCQGATIDVPYTCWEWNHTICEKNVKNTALTRTTNKENIRITNKKLGFIYKFKTENNGTYVGQTQRQIAERIEEHQEKHNIKEYEALTFVLYNELKELLSAEGKHIAKHCPTLNRR